MHIYDYTPQKNTKQITGLIICLTSIGIGPFLFSLIIPNLPYKWLFQLLSIILFTAVIFITSRFAAKSFLYSVIKTDNDTLELTVTEITNGGRSKITVCRISVAGIESIERIDRTDKSSCDSQKKIEKQAKNDGRKSFNYSPNINPSSICLVLCEECGEKFLIKLECDDTLLSYLKNS